MFYNKNQQPVSLAAYAAVNATNAAPQVSSRYSFIPTTTAINILGDHGWQPVAVQQARARKAANVGYQTHSLRFQNTSMVQALQVGTTIPQIALRNAHGGESAFVLDLALLELRCTNGLMADLGGHEQMRITHRKFDPSGFEAALRELCGYFGDLMGTVDRWRTVQVPGAAARSFAQDAINLRWDGAQYSVDPTDLLTATRYEEKESTLWNVYNVVQEKLLKGGVEARQLQGKQRVRRSRSITNIYADARLNKGLWHLASTLEATL
jgi:hypothetical protein